jgi:hypothetical protein
MPKKQIPKRNKARILFIAPYAATKIKMKQKILPALSSIGFMRGLL